MNYINFINFFSIFTLIHNNTVYNFCYFHFPVPFDEDERDKSVWFLDHDYLENKYNMFKKVIKKQIFIK